MWMFSNETSRPKSIYFFFNADLEKDLHRPSFQIALFHKNFLH